MGHVLLVYASHHGQTRAIADGISARLRDQHDTVELVDAAAGPVPRPDPSVYDAVVIGSRIELGRHAPVIVAYLREHRDRLARMTTAFFSVSMAAATPHGERDPNGYLAALFDAVGWRPTHAAAIGGALLYRKYGLITRFVMKRISRRAGHSTDTSRDHVYTDWHQVNCFADEIAADLRGGAAARPTVTA